MGEVDSLFHNRAHEKLMQYLEEGGEALLQKVLNFVEYGQHQDGTAEDLHKPFHRNCRNFSHLSAAQIKVVLQGFHGALWAEQLSARTRLPMLRQLLYLALRVDPGDFLPEKSLTDLQQVCSPRYRQSEPRTLRISTYQRPEDY